MPFMIFRQDTVVTVVSNTGIVLWKYKVKNPYQLYQITLFLCAASSIN